MKDISSIRLTSIKDSSVNAYIDDMVDEYHEWKSVEEYKKQREELAEQYQMILNTAAKLNNVLVEYSFEPEENEIKSIEKILNDNNKFKKIVAFLTLNFDETMSLEKYQDVYSVNEITNALTCLKNITDKSILKLFYPFGGEEDNLIEEYTYIIYNNFSHLNNIELFILITSPVTSKRFTDDVTFKEYFSEILKLNEKTINNFKSEYVKSFGNSFMAIALKVIAEFNDSVEARSYDTSRKINSAAIRTFQEVYFKKYFNEEFYNAKEYKDDYALYLLTKKLNKNSFKYFIKNNYSYIGSYDLYKVAFYILHNDVVEDGELIMPLDWILEFNEVKLLREEDLFLYDEFKEPQTIFGDPLEDYINSVNNYIY